MKNIAIMIWSLHGGGAERIAGLLSKELSKSYNVYLFLNDTENIVYDYAGEIINLAHDDKHSLQYYAAFYKQKLHIDCAISFLLDMNIINVASRGKEVVIISERSSISKVRPPFRREIENIKRYDAHADKIIAVSYGTEYDLVQNMSICKNLVKTIYNFINKEEILKKTKQPTATWLPEFVGNSKLILNVGRLEKQKNHKKLLVQFAKLIHDGENVKLLLVGTGPLERELLDWVDKAGISKYVRIVPYNDNPFPYYRAADILAVTSDYEGLPNVVLEAMLLGLPIVAVDCLSGPRELLKETADYDTPLVGIGVCRNGILVEQTKSDETGETEFFKTALQKLLHDEELYDQIVQNEQEYMAQYSNDDILQQWIDVIENTESRCKEAPKVKIQELEGTKKIIVYGAGATGKQVMQQYIDRKENLELLCFAVTDKSQNPENILGIPVFSIQELTMHRNDAVVLVSVQYRFEQEVVDLLEQYGFRYAFPCV